MKIDFIGDVHGHATRLLALLAALGYRRPTSRRAEWYHPDGNIAHFCGDLVDVGTENLAVIEIVMAMIESGCARAVMGNHDFNIIAILTPDPERPGKFLRSHSDLHLRQSAQTRAEFQREPDRARRALSFLKGLPLWLDMPSYRVAHAAWDQASIAVLRRYCACGDALTDEGFVAASRRSGEAGDARAILQCGPEVDCEPYLDRKGDSRTKERIRWWEAPDDHDPRPLFFGHYSLPTPLAPMRGTFACVDAGIAHGGRIGSYSHEIGRPLTQKGFSYG